MLELLLYLKTANSCLLRPAYLCTKESTTLGYSLNEQGSVKLNEDTLNVLTLLIYTASQTHIIPNFSMKDVLNAGVQFKLGCHLRSI